MDYSCSEKSYSIRPMALGILNRRNCLEIRSFLQRDSLYTQRKTGYHFLLVKSPWIRGG
ncbi:hypothetical protein GG496_000864 [Candidatus Fervidibacteria bacterium JGI MDM2 JNZ-1-D12]